MPDESVVAVGNVLVIADSAQRTVLAERKQVERRVGLGCRVVVLIGNAPRVGQQLVTDIGPFPLGVLRRSRGQRLQTFLIGGVATRVLVKLLNRLAQLGHLGLGRRDLCQRYI